MEAVLTLPSVVLAAPAANIHLLEGQVPSYRTPVEDLQMMTSVMMTMMMMTMMMKI
jgi:hypothetical protein